MAIAALRMMFHGKLKMIGTLFGVVFAVILSNQQAGTFLGLMQKSTMLIDNAGADIWLAPQGTMQVQAGGILPITAAARARVTPGVQWSEPLIFAGATVKRPDGGTEGVSVIGVKWPAGKGGPWNVVSGDKNALGDPDTMVFEDSQRDKYGGMNLGSVREVNGRAVRAGAFTWGLVPFGPSYAFAEYDLARLISRTDSDRTHFVLVGVEPGKDPKQVAEALRAQVPEAVVYTKAEFKRSSIMFVLTRTAIGITFGTATLFGLIVGFVIVSLTMFSSVIDNLREFGTLKAIGGTTGDIAVLLLVQSVMYASMGSVLGLAVVSLMANGIRSAQMALNLSAPLFGATVILMLLLCIFASTLSMLRIRKLEPAMVFR
ncbi:MAG: FtsX-like permease family protein [Polyangiaceae bacterium]|nr:FtsX-like permease family protein [Polyangiaceae bacterium]